MYGKKTVYFHLRDKLLSKGFEKELDVKLPEGVNLMLWRRDRYETYPAQPTLCVAVWTSNNYSWVIGVRGVGVSFINRVLRVCNQSKGLMDIIYLDPTY
jgi:hypothetical protein